MEQDRQMRLEQMIPPLLSWFGEHARVLPWREEPTPYRVWVSEIMLQQTRVEAVKPFFERFIEALPDVKDLAECQEEPLLKLWEGLGYYNRVRNMQKAAREVMEKYNGKMPADYEALLSLPGIGSYTAGAVASIAYGIPVPAVDGNVLRVLSRLTLCEEDILKQSVKKRWEQSLLAVMPREAPGDLNQALMELGATVCVPNGMAKCEECPISGLCLARKEDRVLEFPKKTPKKARRIEKRTVFLIRDGDAAAIRRRPKSGLLAGLYELPNVSGHLSMEEALEKAKEMDLSPLRIQPIGEAKHIFSHVEWHMIGYQIRVEHLTEKGRTDMIFVEPEETEERYPIPAAFGAYIRFLQIRLGQEKYEEK